MNKLSLIVMLLLTPITCLSQKTAKFGTQETIEIRVLGDLQISKKTVLDNTRELIEKFVACVMIASDCKKSAAYYRSAVKNYFSEQAIIQLNSRRKRVPESLIAETYFDRLRNRFCGPYRMYDSVSYVFRYSLTNARISTTTDEGRIVTCPIQQIFCGYVAGGLWYSDTTIKVVYITFRSTDYRAYKPLIDKVLIADY